MFSTGRLYEKENVPWFNLWYANHCLIILYRNQFNNYNLQLYINVSSQSFCIGKHFILSCYINVLTANVLMSSKSFEASSHFVLSHNISVLSTDVLQ